MFVLANPALKYPAYGFTNQLDLHPAACVQKLFIERDGRSFGPNFRDHSKQVLKTLGNTDKTAYLANSVASTLNN